MDLPGLEPETSGLITKQALSHLSYPALWIMAVPNSQLVFAGVGGGHQPISMHVGKHLDKYEGNY